MNCFKLITLAALTLGSFSAVAAEIQFGEDAVKAFQLMANTQAKEKMKSKKPACPRVTVLGAEGKLLSERTIQVQGKPVEVTEIEYAIYFAHSPKTSMELCETLKLKIKEVTRAQLADGGIQQTYTYKVESFDL